MSLYFPLPNISTDIRGIKSIIFKIPNQYQTEIKLVSIPPKTKIDLHSHNESQIGMCVKGKFMMSIDGEEQILESCRTAYVIAPNILHSAENCFNEDAIGLDIKSLTPPTIHKETPTFLNHVNNIKLSTGISTSFFVGPWCEIMVSKIPKGGSMPMHKHTNEQFGIALIGKYIMQVSNEKQEFKYGQIYYSPGNIVHGAHNPFDEEAISLNIFLPHRYNKPLKHKR